MRIDFFLNPLCQCLWTNFISEAPKAVLNSIRYIKSDRQKGYAKFDILLKEVLAIEEANRFTCLVLPEIARNWE